MIVSITPMSGKQKVHRFTSTQVDKYTPMSGKPPKLHRFTSTQVHKYTPISGKQVAYKSTQVHKNAPMQTYHNTYM